MFEYYLQKYIDGEMILSSSHTPETRLTHPETPRDQTHTPRDAQRPDPHTRDAQRPDPHTRDGGKAPSLHSGPREAKLPMGAADHCRPNQTVVPFSRPSPRNDDSPHRAMTGNDPNCLAVALH